MPTDSPVIVYVVVSLLISISRETSLLFVPSYIRYPPISLNEIGLPSSLVFGISQLKSTDSEDTVGAGSEGAGLEGTGVEGTGSEGIGSEGTTPGVIGTVCAVPGRLLVPPPPHAVMRVLSINVIRVVWMLFMVFE